MPSAGAWEPGRGDIQRSHPSRGIPFTGKAGQRRQSQAPLDSLAGVDRLGLLRRRRPLPGADLKTSGQRPVSYRRRNASPGNTRRCIPPPWAGVFRRARTSFEAFVHAPAVQRDCSTDPAAAGCAVYLLPEHALARLPDCPTTGIPGGAPTFSPDTTLSSSMTADLAGRSVNGATDNHRGSVLPAPAYAAYVFGACPAGRLPSPHSLPKAPRLDRCSIPSTP